MSHYNLLHKFIRMLQTLKIPDAKAAVDKDWEELEKLLPMQKTNVRSKKEVMQEAQKEGRTVHFASLMDICHFKNAELEPTFQKYKGRVVLRGDIAKDDSGSYAVFADEGSLLQDYQDAQDKQQMQYQLTYTSVKMENAKRKQKSSFCLTDGHLSFEKC